MTGFHEATSMHWRVVAAKAVGTSHRRAGTECEDHFAFLRLDNGILLVALADGAGSASHGSVGAKVAVEAAIKAAERLLLEGQQPNTADAWSQVMASVLDLVRQAVVASASQFQETASGSIFEGSAAQSLGQISSLRDFATTLLVAILSQTWATMMQVGDGMVVTATENGEYCCPINSDENDNPYVNVTHFITDQDYKKWARSTTLGGSNLKGVALLTDGLQVLASSLANRHPHPPFFKPLFAFASDPNATDEDLEGFLNSERVNARTDDDKTLVIAVQNLMHFQRSLLR